jgi:hypothetical protein
MIEETKITHESLNNLNDAIKSNIGNDNKPSQFLNVAGVYRYKNENYTRPLRTDEFGNLKTVQDTKDTIQEVTNEALTNLNKTIKNNAVNVNINNSNNLSVTDEFLENQNLSAFQDVSKGAQKLKNDASTFPKLLVHNVRPETTPVVNQTDDNNITIPLQCNVDNTLEIGQVIKPLHSTLRLLPGSQAQKEDVKTNPNNLDRIEIMADSTTTSDNDSLKHPNALQTVDQNLKNVFGTGSYRLDHTEPLIIGTEIYTDLGNSYIQKNEFFVSDIHAKEYTENELTKITEVSVQISEWWLVIRTSNNISALFEIIAGIPLDVREHHYIIDNTNHKDVRIFGSIIWSSSEAEADKDQQFFIMGSNDNEYYYKMYMIDESQTIHRTDGYDGTNSNIEQNDFDILIRDAPKYLKFKNSENGRRINSVRIYYSQYT